MDWLTGFSQFGFIGFSWVSQFFRAAILSKEIKGKLKNLTKSSRMFPCISSKLFSCRIDQKKTINRYKKINYQITECG